LSRSFLIVVNLMDGDGSSTTDDDPDSCSGDASAANDVSADDASADDGIWADDDGRMPRIDNSMPCEGIFAERAVMKDEV
jgi:hypothetical protein